MAGSQELIRPCADQKILMVGGPADHTCLLCMKVKSLMYTNPDFPDTAHPLGINSAPHRVPTQGPEPNGLFMQSEGVLLTSHDAVALSRKQAGKHVNATSTAVVASQPASAAAPRLLFGPLGVEPATHRRGEALLQEAAPALLLFCSVCDSFCGPCPSTPASHCDSPYGFVAAVWLPTQRAHVLLPHPAEV